MKYMAFLGALFLVSTAAAGECVGGRWITANSVDSNPNGNCTEATCNGETFCRSNGPLNWWSAFTWCASNGLHLATFQEMCPGVPSAPNDTTGACPNLQGRGENWAWSQTGVSRSTGVAVQLSYGGIRVDRERKYNELFGYMSALCH